MHCVTRAQGTGNLRDPGEMRTLLHDQPGPVTESPPSLVSVTHSCPRVAVTKGCARGVMGAQRVSKYIFAELQRPTAQRSLRRCYFLKSSENSGKAFLLLKEILSLRGRGFLPVTESPGQLV
jgi:hypothetical protein